MGSLPDLPQLLIEVQEASQKSQNASLLSKEFNSIGQVLNAVLPILNSLENNGSVDTFLLEVQKMVDFANEFSNKSKEFLSITSRILIHILRKLSQSFQASMEGIPQTSATSHLLSKINEIDTSMKSPDYSLYDQIEQAMNSGLKDSAEIFDQLPQLAESRSDASLLVSDMESAKEWIVSDLDLKYFNFVLPIVEKLAVGHGDLKRAGSRGSKRWDDMALVAIQPASAPPEFICPLSGKLMEDPVQTETGAVFERTVVEAWLSSSDSNRICPVTGRTVTSLVLTPKDSVKEAMAAWRRQSLAPYIEKVFSKLAASEEAEIEAGLLLSFKISEDNPTNRQLLAELGIVKHLVPLLRWSSRSIRRKTLATLMNLSSNDDDIRSEVAQAGAIPLAVRSLARDLGESRQAVALLLELSKSDRLCEEIGKAQGSILLLVTMLSSENGNAARDARAVLDQLSSNDDNVVQMAEANHFKPLVQRLLTGSEMTKVVMASALSRIPLTNQSNSMLTQAGAIQPLVEMISSSKFEVKSAAVSALKNMSAFPENCDTILSAAVVPPLLQLLFSMASTVKSLKEESAAIIANLATADPSRSILSVQAAQPLGSEETIFQFLSLLSLAGHVLQGHLLKILFGLASDPSRVEVRDRMRVGGIVTVLMPFLDSNQEQLASDVRLNATRLLMVLSREAAMASEITENLMDGGGAWLRALVKLLSDKVHHSERAAAAGVLAGLPRENETLTTALEKADALRMLVQMLKIRTVTGSRRDSVLENATGALIRFTLPSQPKLQQQVARMDAIPTLVSILLSGTAKSKAHSAACLHNLAQASHGLSVTPSSRGTFSCFKSQVVDLCCIHGGECSVEKTYCLLEAEAVEPLVAVLSDMDPSTIEFALSSLATIVSDEGKWENGVKLIHDANGFDEIIRLLSEGSERSKSKALWIVEKLFRIEDFKFLYGAKAIGALVEMTQKGSLECKPVAAKTLSHLEVLHIQSSYF